jgi:hypothetical protein
MSHEPESEPLDEMRRLRAELQPERDLWPGIALRIHAERAATARRRERFKSAAIAAALALVVGAVAWRTGSRAPIETPQLATATRREAPGDVSRPSSQREAPGDVSRPSSQREAPGDVSRPSSQREAPGDVSRHQTSLAAYAEIDRTLSSIRDDLRRSIDAHQERLPPETRALVFENLRTIDRAITEIEAALEGAPAGSELARTYIAYREREIDLLRQANRLVARL